MKDIGGKFRAMDEAGCQSNPMQTSNLCQRSACCPNLVGVACLKLVNHVMLSQFAVILKKLRGEDGAVELYTVSLLGLA